MSEQTQQNQIFQREKQRLEKKIALQSKRLEETKKLLADVNSLIR